MNKNDRMDTIKQANVISHWKWHNVWSSVISAIIAIADAGKINTVTNKCPKASETRKQFPRTWNVSITVIADTINIAPIEPIVDTNDNNINLNTRFHEFQLSSGGHIIWFGL